MFRTRSARKPVRIPPGIWPKLQYLPLENDGIALARSSSCCEALARRTCEFRTKRRCIGSLFHPSPRPLLQPNRPATRILAPRKKNSVWIGWNQIRACDNFGPSAAPRRQPHSRHHAPNSSRHLHLGFDLRRHAVGLERLRDQARRMHGAR